MSEERVHMDREIVPVRWLRTPRGDETRKAHLYIEGYGVSLCGRMTFPASTTEADMIEVPVRERLAVRCCSFCWRLRS